MKKTLVIFTLLLLSMYSCAQDTAVQNQVFDVSISIVGFGGDWVTNSMGVQAGVDFRLKNNVSMQCDFRYIFDVRNKLKNRYLIVSVDDLAGLAVDTDIKIYVKKFKNELRGMFFGGRLLFLFTKSSLDEYQVKRSKLGLYGIIGWKYISKSGFLFEATTGPGIQVISSNSTHITSNIFTRSYEFPWSKPYDYGTYFYPDLSMNIRIGWRF